MAIDKEQTLWVTSIGPEDIEGSNYIPTALLYDADGSIKIGKQAEIAESSGAIVNRDFKIELGEVVPGGSVENRKRFQTNRSEQKSSYELTKDYFSRILHPIEQKLGRSTDLKVPARIIVAEPLSFQIENLAGSWISNYRQNIRRILSQFEEVDFLPEPFAVYQYYRYGIRVPTLQDNTKNIAFIIDFGGGTFDACVIESTNSGDISQTGKHSRPLSADSCPVGGFSINREIASYLIKRDLPEKEKPLISKYLEQFSRVESGTLNEDDLRDEARMFFKNFRNFSKKVEGIKLKLVSEITNWRLEGEHYEKIVIDKPANPLHDESMHTSEFFAHQLRLLFEKNIWDKSLKKTVKNVLDRACDSLSGRKINLTLISGGSANIRWLEKLLMRDFGHQLAEAEPFPISHSFQEVVANGLAIECARRFYAPESEFVAVTYNPVRLFLNPDGSGSSENGRYKSIGDKIDMEKAKEFDLIPAAQSLKHFFDMPLQWRIKLSKSPRRYLDYYFARPDHDNYKDCYNVESTRVATRDNSQFDSHIKLELTVREDGTATPKFIYKSGNIEHGISENAEVGKPFYLDMTTDSERSESTSGYVGLDFGTSNSSVCFLSNSSIKILAKREKDKTWRSLSASIAALPYPVAVTLRSFMQSRAEATDSCALARECFESSLTFMAYVALAELSNFQDVSGLVRAFQHRAMGPLKGLLVNSLDGLRSKDSFFSKCYFEILNSTSLRKLDQAINDFTDHKHDKKSAEFDYQGHLDFIVSLLHAGLSGFYFGYSTRHNLQPFAEYRYSGKFVVAHDSYPYRENFSYESDCEIMPFEALLVSKSGGRFLCLSPLLFWWDTEDQAMPKKAYWYDRPSSSKSNSLVKVCGQKSAIEAASLNAGLGRAIDSLCSGTAAKFRQGDLKIAYDEDS